MMKSKNFILTTIVCLLPMIMGIIIYDKLPDNIPSYFNTLEEVNEYMPKPQMVFGMPIFLAFMNIFLVFMLNNDPKKKNFSTTIRNIYIWFIPFMSVVMVSLNLFVGLGYDVPVSIIVNSLVGIIFIITGNYLPKSRQNYTIGIKIPWTLNSEENWNKTHRLAGKLWIIGGVLMILGSILKIAVLQMTLILIIPLILIPYGYSFMLYKKEIG